MAVGKVFKKMLGTAERQSPTILTGLGTVGILTTVGLAIRATPKALHLIEMEEEKRFKENRETTISKVDVVKIVWKCYIPTVLSGGLTIACFLSAHSINLRRNAAWATLYTVSETALKEYQEKVIETIGENKERKIREAVSQDKLDANPVSKSEVIVTGTGETLMYDSWSGRYFKGNLETVRKIVNDLNYRILGGADMYLPLNSFYQELGLKDIKAGNNIGWSFDYGQLELDISTMLADTGQACIVLGYKIEPKPF